MSAVQPYRRGQIIVIPKRAENARGDVGVGWVDLSPDDPGYAEWDRYLKMDPLVQPAQPVAPRRRLSRRIFDTSGVRK